MIEMQQCLCDFCMGENCSKKCEATKTELRSGVWLCDRIDAQRNEGIAIAYPHLFDYLKMKYESRERSW